MARNGMIEAEGTVQKVLGGGFYEVRVGEAASTIKVKLSGRLRQHSIRVLPEDQVRLDLSEADPTSGFIVYRIG
jgi:translation initiation factor IF-1